MSRSKNEHILNASSNLLGFSFIAVTSLRALNLINTTYMDKFAVMGVLIFAISATLSFLSIRSTGEKTSKMLENLAEYLFLSGLAIILIVVVLIELRII